MAAPAREIAYRTYRAPRLSSLCLDPVRIVYGTPAEALAEMLTTIAPLPARLEIVAVDVNTTQIFDPAIVQRSSDPADDPPVGILIVRGLAVAEVFQAVLDLARLAWEPNAPDAA
jgi:hypothetical protein